MYAAHRPGDETNTYWRVAQFLMPFWSLPPINQLGINFLARAWVSIDDAHTMIVLLTMKGTGPTKREGLYRNVPGSDLFPGLLANSTDWLGRWRTVANRGNDYLIDRAVQRTQSYTGIDGITMQDHAITESIRGITEHTFEHLAPSDLAIAKVRRILVRSARAHAKADALPPSAADPAIYGRARGG